MRQVLQGSPSQLPFRFGQLPVSLTTPPRAPPFPLTLPSHPARALTLPSNSSVPHNSRRLITANFLPLLVVTLFTPFSRANSSRGDKMSDFKDGRQRRTHKTRGEQNQRAIRDLNKAIRAIPGLYFYGRGNQSVVHRSVTGTLLGLFTDTTENPRGLSDLDRSLVAASRAKGLLETAIDITDRPTASHWTIVGVWKEVIEKMHHRGLSWQEKFTPKKVADVFDSLVRARSEYQRSPSYSREAPMRGFQNFLVSLDRWIAAKDKMKLLSKPHTSQHVQSPNQAIKSEESPEQQASEAPNLLRSGERTESPRATIGSTLGGHVQDIKHYPKNLGRASGAQAAAYSTTSSDEMNDALHAENDRLRAENMRQTMMIQAMALERGILKTACQQFDFSSKNLRAENATLRAGIATLHSDIATQHSTADRLRMNIERLQSIRDILWAEVRRYENPVQRAHGWLEWEADDLDAYLESLQHFTYARDHDLYSP
ncbi:hypothetical protein CKAH01_10724 [Colletotrichum kahawae]|uniref:Uncharacterized protein n=1 Tax=Colletotrichum kahawae TaxID=34407 RepID=A0AAE0CX76_COLKA|nr:hypothetical protein CKAH01_10724 [Colletotrichum kahawae]